MVMADRWRAGIPAYLVVRRLLELGSVEECLEELRRLPLASSRCYTIVDSTSAVQAETTPDGVAVLDAPPLAHTNHFLDPELAARDRSHVVIRRESKRRLAHLETRIAAGFDDGDAESLFGVVATHDEPPLCFHGSGDPRAFTTVAAVVLRPVEGELIARPAPVCTSASQVHRMRGTA